MLNSPPTNITLSSQNINENTASGTSIATLSTTDPDVGDTHTYTIVAGAGDEDNAKFTIDTNNLKLNFTPDYETPTDHGDTVGNNTYTVRIQTDDGNGGTYQKSFVITVDNVNEPPVITSTNLSSVSENTTATVLTVTATDPEGGLVNYSIIGGVDRTKFSITVIGGEIKFQTAPDFENPIDVGGDNVYNIQVKAMDMQ